LSLPGGTANLVAISPTALDAGQPRRARRSRRGTSEGYVKAGISIGRARPVTAIFAIPPGADANIFSGRDVPES